MNSIILNDLLTFIFTCIILFINCTYILSHNNVKIITRTIIIFALAIINKTLFFYSFNLFIKFTVIYIIMIVISKLIKDSFTSFSIYKTSIIMFFYLFFYLLFHLYFLRSHPFDSNDIYVHYPALLSSSVCLVMVYPLLNLVRKDKTLILFASMSAIITLLIPLLLWITNSLTINNYLFIILYLSLLLLFLIMHIIMFVYVKISHDNEIANHITLSEDMLTLYQNEVQIKNNEIKKIKHDIQDQLNAIRKLNLDNCSSEIVDKIEENLERSTSIIYTNSPIIDAYLNYIINTQKDYTFIIRSDNLSNVNIKQTDLLLIIINLIKNAYSHSTKGSTIVLQAVAKNNSLIMKVSNPYVPQKTHNSGLGLSIVENILKKYNGSSFIHVSENKFNAYIEIGGFTFENQS